MPEGLEDRRVRGTGRFTAFEAPGNRKDQLDSPSGTWDHQNSTHGPPNSQIFAPQRYNSPSRIPQATSKSPGPEAVSPKSLGTVHQRSHSDLGALFSQQPLSREVSNRIRLPSIGLDQPTIHRHSLSPGPNLSMARAEASDRRLPLHSRHQSTPLISNPLEPSRLNIQCLSPTNRR